MKINVVLSALKEGVDGFRRAKFSAVIAVTTVSISLILMGIFLVATYNFARLVSSLRTHIALEAFIDGSMDDAKIERLRESILKIEGVESIQFISQKQAAADFQREFGPEYFELLEDNPLPPSFQIRLLPSHRNVAQAQRISAKVRSMEGVQDLIFERELLSVLERYINVAVAVDFLLGTIVSLAALFLVSNNIRLVIYAKRDLIDIMQLVGATRDYVRLPFLLEGLLQGLGGGVLASGTVYALVAFLSGQLFGLIQAGHEIYYFLIAYGGLLGAAGSWVAIRKFLV